MHTVADPLVLTSAARDGCSSGGTRVLYIILVSSLQRIIDDGSASPSGTPSSYEGEPINMQLGMIGLGRMGGSMVRRLIWAVGTPA